MINQFPVRYMSPSQIWDMSTDEVIAVKNGTYSKELADITNKILKVRKEKILKELDKV